MFGKACVAVVVFVAALAAAHPHVGYPEAPNVPVRNEDRPTEVIIGGSGDYKFQYDPTKLQLPASVSLRNGHGLAKDANGYIYFTYESTSVDASTRALIRFDPDGTNAMLLGSDNTLAQGTPHGLRIKDNALYHANNQALLTKTDLKGNILWRQDLSGWAKNNFSKWWPVKPTDSISPPGSDIVYLSDGYGSSFVHGFSDTTGEYVGPTFGGAGNATTPAQQFHCPHGINWDARRNTLLVSDRGNSRLQYVTNNGSHLSTINMAAGSPLAAAGTEPCNVDVSTTTGNALVPGLDGPVGLLDSNMNILTVIEVGQLIKGCPHPHDGIMLDNGDVIVCCWNPGMITYWRKL